jgi:DNA helicase HerA-like ATPase
MQGCPILSVRIDSMTVDSSVLHHDPGAPPEELRLRGRIDFASIAARVVMGEEQSARDAEPNDLPIAIHSHDHSPIEFTEDERRRHIEIIGKTGQGKSTLLKNLAMRDIRDGKAVVYFDPHGLDAPALIDSIPRHRTEKVCYLDLTDKTHPVAWNPLFGIPLERSAIVAANITEGFRDIFYEAWSERMAWFLRNGLALLIEAGDATLADLPPLYFDERHRKRFVQGAKTDATKQFWLREYPAYPENYRREAPGAIVNRIGQLLAAPPAAAILTQRTSTLDLQTCIDSGYIVIVNLAKGSIGNNAASLFGSLLISQLRNAVMSRADRPNEEYRPVSFLIDEFHSFATLSLAQLLAESRKYNLQLTIAHQYAAQLKPEVQAAILGNVGTIIAFRVGFDDAKVLIGDFDPYQPAMLTDQTPTHARMKRDLQPCQIQTVPFEPEERGRYDTVVRASRRRFAGQA